MFKKYLLKDLLTIRNGKDYKTLNPGKVPLYGSGGVMSSVDNYIYDGESILLPRKGTLDNICYVSGKFWTIDTMYWSVINTKLTNPKYLYLYLSILDLSFQNSGSTLPSMTFDAYYSIPVYLPSKKEQDFIAESVFTLIEKIENNNRIISELESMAKLIYDYWFVQFDFPDENGRPYKSNGGKMVWNDELKREIPEGWEVETIRNVSEKVTKGTTPTTLGFDYTDCGIKFIRVENIGFGAILQNDMLYISEEANTAMKRSSLNANDIILTIAGRLGDIAIVPEYILPANTNQAVGIIRLKKDYERLGLYIRQLLMTDIMRKQLGLTNAQSIQKNLNLQNVSDIQFPYCKRIINVFYNKIAVIAQHRDVIERENYELTHLRDFLLPLLMNGQVTIGEKAGEIKEVK